MTQSSKASHAPLKKREPLAPAPPFRLQRKDDPLLRRLPPPLREQIVALRSLPMRPFLRRSALAIATYLEQMLPYIQEAMQKGYSLHEIYKTLANAHPLAIGERQFRKYMQMIFQNHVCIACGQQKIVKE